MKKCGFFEEAPGEFSLTRLIVFIGTIYAMGLTQYTVIVKQGLTMEIALSFGAIMTVFGAIKVTSKISEVKKEIANGPVNPETPAQ